MTQEVLKAIKDIQDSKKHQHPGFCTLKELKAKFPNKEIKPALRTLVSEGKIKIRETLNSWSFELLEY